MSVDPEYATRSGIDRTETALWLLIVGVLIGPDPLFNSSGIGTTLTIIGIILVALGRSAFGQKTFDACLPISLPLFLRVCDRNRELRRDDLQSIFR